MVESRCGILCSACEYQGQVGCKGCLAIPKPFWGEVCPLKACCEGRGLAHCGQCGDFPCDRLTRFSYDAEQGDQGRRIQQCKQWAGTPPADVQNGGLRMVAPIAIRELNPGELPKALRLVWRVFQEYEAPDYAKEGVEEFYQSIHDEAYVSQLCLYGAFAQEDLVGVLATRNRGTHLALFFVEGACHRQGIGTRLLQRAWAQGSFGPMTVNASPYAVPIYRKLGFQDTDAEQVVRGLRFTPMKLERAGGEREGTHEACHDPRAES